MRLRATCARCGATLVASAGEAAPGADDAREGCPLHGRLQPCWRPESASYEAFAEHLVLSRGLPTWLPWPLPPGWGVTDFGCVGGEGQVPRATFGTAAGLTPEDGGVALTVVTEEPGVGLGAHLAGVPFSDPGRAAWDQPPAMRLRLDNASVPLWPVPDTDRPEGSSDGVPDRTVLAGEAHGRWLWLVVSPAEAVLGLIDRATLRDASGLGPELVAVPFGAPEA